MKKNWKYSLLLITIVFAVAMGIFFLFYRFDNKYTAKGDQAIQGILYVPDDDTVHYLAREWEYYPDVLLTPQELKKHKDEYYSRYVSIGEYGGMDMGDKNRSPFGSVTYRMNRCGLYGFYIFCPGFFCLYVCAYRKNRNRIFLPALYLCVGI